MRALIVDDEELARRRLRQVLAEQSDVAVVGECSNAVELPRRIAELSPDVVFLDIEMPAASGLDAARKLGEGEAPLIVFTTAFERYASDAFDVDPVDYLLKPIEPGRFQRALDRVRRMLALRRGEGAERLPDERRYIDRLFVRDGERLVLIDTSHIERIDAVGNYVKIHTATISSLFRCTLAALELRLDPTRFIRTHRSHIVNIRKVREMLPVSHGDYTLIFESGAKAPVSRVYRERLAAFEL